MRTWLSTSAAHDGREQSTELAVQEGQRGLVTHRVLREVRLLHLRVHGVAVERGGQRDAVLEIWIIRCAGRGAAADVPGIGGAELHARGRGPAGRTSHGLAEVDVAGLVA